MLDTNAPTGQRDRLFGAIEETPALTWLLLTKREGNLGLLPLTLPANLWLGMTAENQEYLLRRGNALSKVKAAIKFLVVEPMLSAIDLWNWTIPMTDDIERFPEEFCVRQYPLASVAE